MKIRCSEVPAVERESFTRRSFISQCAGLAALSLTLPMWSTASADSRAAMKTYRIPRTDLVVSRIGYGCADLGGSWDREAVTAETITAASRLIQTACDHGITLFDHADIYGYGKSEAAFGEVLKRSPGLRERMVIQSKCGVHLAWPRSSPPLRDPNRLDFSYAHIINAVEGSLRRLSTDRIDILLLHRPDPLVEPDEVAKAFEELEKSGKVRSFGVSNHTPGQIELLKRSVRQPIVVNQVQLGLAHSGLIVDGMEFNRDGSTRLTEGYTGAVGALDYCRQHDIQVQAWSPLQGVPLKPLAADAAPNVKHFAQVLGTFAKEKNVSPAALALAWLLRHPAGIVPITTSRNPERIIENCAADRVELTRAEWYTLLMAGGGFGAVA